MQPYNFESLAALIKENEDLKETNKVLLSYSSFLESELQTLKNERTEEDLVKLGDLLIEYLTA